MKKRWMPALILLLVCTLIFTACSGGSGGGSNDPKPTDKPQTTTNDGGSNNGSSDGGTGNEDAKAVYTPTDTDMSGKVTFWTFSPEIHSEIYEEFQKVYPNIKVDVVGIDFGDLHDRIQTTLAAGKGAPDLAQVEQGQFPRYVIGDVLEDLLQQPYDAGKYRGNTTEYNWIRWMSMDNEQLLGMPWDVTPGVMYYRADIFEELGLPSEPEELGEYIKDEENWLVVVETLAGNGKYSMEWHDGPVHWLGDAYGYFDGDLNWMRNSDEFVRLLDITKRQNQMQVAPNMSGLFDDAGKALVQSGQLPAFMLGSWGAREIEKAFPEQAGKWRVTNLPLGIYAGMGGSAFIMPKQSDNKEATWKFLEWMQFSEEAWKVFMKWSVQPGWKSITSLPWYQDIESPFLGNQRNWAMYSEIAEHIPVRKLTSIDGPSWGIWLDGILKAIRENVDSRTTLQQIEDNIARELKPDLDRIKSELGK